ncbi:MAG: glycine oxidase ThiO [Micromonosporaceae bacterium]|nr:glycine oxidase ThiO [Micromonosporaceae bacterium]
MTVDVAVVGGGVIGFAVAWRCAQRGLSVTVFDHQPAAPEQRASQVAAGMLGPVSEAYFGEADLTALLVASAAQWAGFATELAPFGDVGYRTDGTLVVALTADDHAEAARLWTYQESLGLPMTVLGAAALREREPALHPRVRGGALAGDYQADPRRLLRALRAAAAAAGVRVVDRRLSAPELSELDAATVVVAAGCGSAALTGLPVRPVKGQVLRLRAPDGEPGFRHVIRGWADGRRVYLVPRTAGSGGEVVVGATEEELTDAVPTAGATLELLRAAVDLVPSVAEHAVAELCVGHRPGTPDNAPILGRLSDRLVVATGHYRHGILLAPVTADTIAELVATGETPELIAPFTPARFRAGGDGARS